MSVHHHPPLNHQQLKTLSLNFNPSKICSEKTMMAFSRVSLSRVSLFWQNSLTSHIPLSLSNLTLSPQLDRIRFSPSASLSTQDSPPSVDSIANPKQGSRWKPTCLYHTQGKCTMMDDPTHLERFNHSCSEELKISAAVAAEFKETSSQQLDFFLVLDLEGKVEILEFPVLMLDAKTMDVVDVFHRFVRPSAMSEQRISEYIEGKYGKIGVDRVWHDTAIPFEEVIQGFEGWMARHQLWENKQGGCLRRAAFVTWNDHDDEGTSDTSGRKSPSGNRRCEEHNKSAAAHAH